MRRCQLPAQLFGLAVCFLLSTGCHSIDKIPVVYDVPSECSLASLPDYVIRPPDLLTISAVNLVPKHPYSLRPLDSVSLQIDNLGDGVPFSGEFDVGIDGTLAIGGPLDYVDDTFRPIVAAGKTIDQLQADIQQRVARIINNPHVSLAITGLAPIQDVAGDHLVASDGRITLGSYGRVHVAGLTIDQAKSVVEAYLSAEFDQPSVSLDVAGFNSSTYFIIKQGAGLGDEVVRLPITGSETVLTAISEVDGLSATSSAKMWIARPGCGDQPNCKLPVNWCAITQEGDPTTNYQLMPGDRLYIAENKLVALDTALAKIISPIERILGVTLLGTQTTREIAFFNEIGQNQGINGGF